MHRRFISNAAALVVAAFFCAACLHRSVALATHQPDSDEIAVYRAVLADTTRSTGSRTKPGVARVFLSETIPTLRARRTDLELLTRLESANSRATLPKDLAGPETVLVTRDDVNKLVRPLDNPAADYPAIDALWDPFYEKYPGANGIHGFTRVAFDDSRKTALVEHIQQCGVLCGFGEIVVLRRGADGWRISWSETTYLQ